MSNSWTNTLHDPAELVAEDVAFLELHYGAVVEVEVTAADGGASDAEDDVGGVDEGWFRYVAYLGGLV